MKKDLMVPLVGKVIKVDRGGPNSKSGKLLSVADDFFTLMTEDEGVVYFAMHHIKSFTENSKNNMQFELEIPENFEYKMSSSFTPLLDCMKYQWVQINRGGPDKLEGVLHECNKDFVVVVNNDEVVRLATFHIKNISYGLILEKPNKEEQTEKKEK